MWFFFLKYIKCIISLLTEYYLMSTFFHVEHERGTDADIIFDEKDFCHMINYNKYIPILQNPMKLQYRFHYFLFFARKNVSLFPSYMLEYNDNIRLLLGVFSYNLHIQFTLKLYAQSIYRRIPKYHACRRKPREAIWL